MTLFFTRLSVLVSLGLLLTTPAAEGQTMRYVSPTGTNTNPATATSWATSTTDLQGAINASASGNQVWVAAGTYKPGGNANLDKTISFTMKAGVAIYGGFVGNEVALANRPTINLTTPSSTTLSGDIGTVGNTADNSYHVINNASGLASSAMLDGFLITGGNSTDYGGGIYSSSGSPTLQNCWFQGNSSAIAGGAIYNSSSSPVLTNCRFEGNTSGYGSAIYNLTASNPQLTNCTFQRNRASVNGGAILNVSSNPTLTDCSFLLNQADNGAGGGISNNNSSPQLTNCSFQGNSAPGSDGGAMVNTSNSSPQLTNCSFQSNSAYFNGGALSNASGSSPQLTRCTFLSNSAQTGGAVYANTGSLQYKNCSFQGNTAAFAGGALYNLGSSSQLVNCSFLNNSATSFNGGAIYNDSSSPNLTNCSFQGNSASSFYGGGAMYNKTGSNTQLVNCVFFDNGSNQTFGNVSSTLTAQYSLFDNTVTGYSGSNNLTTAASPFSGTSSNTLKGCAAAINSGLTSAGGLSGITTDLAGNSRFYSGGVVDMGAYEYQGSPVVISVTNPAVTNTTTGIDFTQTFGASGSAGTYTFSVASGSLPTGLNLATSGVLAGNASQSGTFPITVQAADAVGCVGIGTTYPLLVTLSVLPAIRYVTPTGSNTTPFTATSWVTATSDLQGAINASVAGDQVWVASGTYKPTTGTSRSISFSMKNGVAIYGGFVGNEAALANRPTVNLTTPSGSILSGDIGTVGNASDNSYHVINNPSGLTNSAILDGFVITGGNANGLSTDGHGGGMYNYTSEPTVQNCTFQANAANQFGGAMYTYYTNNPRVLSCSFQNNSAVRGGAIYISDCSMPAVKTCSFLGNSAQSGGAIYSMYSTLNLTNSVFQNNSALSSDGGGAVCNSISNSVLVNCSFLGNSATKGGAIVNQFSTPQITNCSFQGNSASAEGGAMYNYFADGPQVANSVFFGNGEGNTIANTTSTLTAQYSFFDNTVTGYSGSNNLNSASSPFLNTSSNQLRPDSPAINAGLNSAAGLSGITTDLAGNPRFYNGGQIDMGAYEYQGVPLPVTLRYFSGRMTEAGALLGWGTVREDDNTGFRIERSHDAVGFEPIASIPSQATNGNSVTPLTYTYTDARPLPGVNYYRLIQTDLDGTRTVSKIIALSKENQQTVLYPNPVGTLGEAELEPALAYTSYELVDMLGRVCQQASTPGTLSRLSVGTLPAGVYVLRVMVDGGNQQAFRIIR